MTNIVINDRIKSIKCEKAISRGVIHIKERTKPEEYIPDYEHIFYENAAKKGNGGGILLTILKSNSLKILISTFFYIIKASGLWIVPIVTANVINILTEGQDDAMRSILINVLILVVILIQNVPTHYLYARYSDRILRNIGAGLRNTLIKKLQHLSITYHKEMESGRIQAKFMRDIEAIEGLASHFIKSVIPAIIGIIVSMSVAIYKNGYVPLFYLVVVPLNVVLIRVFKKKIKESNYRFRKESENISASVSTMIEMIPVTKAHGLEDEEIKHLEENIKTLKKEGLDLDKAYSIFGSIVWVVSELLSVSCLLFTAVLALNGRIQVGDIVIFQTYFNSISNNVQSLVNLYPQLSKGLESIRSVSEVMLSDDVEDNRGKLKLNKIDGRIEFKNVSYHYPDGRENVVKNLSFIAEPGECIAFVGSSGSGKSTTMNMIIGFLRSTEGKVTVDGHDIKDINLTLYRHNLSVVPQNTILFTGSIRDNITYGLENVDEETLKNVVKQANIEEFLPKLSNGLDTIIGEHGDKLSGGQKQRISIARALLRDPKILILDEATSALDNISEYQVQKAINEVKKNRTTFIVAHRLSTIRNADKIIVMENGECVEQGTFAELMDKKGRFYELKKLSDAIPTETRIDGE